MLWTIQNISARRKNIAGNINKLNLKVYIYFLFYFAIHRNPNEFYWSNKTDGNWKTLGTETGFPLINGSTYTLTFDLAFSVLNINVIETNWSATFSQETNGGNLSTLMNVIVQSVKVNYTNWLDTKPCLDRINSALT